MATYLFQHLSAQNGWQYIGEEAVSGETSGGETSGGEAFSRLAKSQEPPPGDYRFRRFDDGGSHDWGHLTLTEDGVIVPGDN